MTFSLNLNVFLVKLARMFKKYLDGENILKVSLASQVGFDSTLSVPVLGVLTRAQPPFLLDNGLDYAVFTDKSELYTTVGVKDEDPRNRCWVTLEREDHLLSTYTRSDFKTNGNVVQVTGMGIYAGISTKVFYDTVGISAICPGGYSTTVTLTSDQGAVSVCSHLSATDFGLLVVTVALPYNLVSRDTCLGWCTRYLNSYKQESMARRLNKWSKYYS